MQTYSDRYCKIDYIEAQQQIYMKWLKPPDERNMLQVYVKALSLASYTNAVTMVVDNSIGFTVSMSTQRSLVSLAASKLNQISIRKFARIAPHDIFQEIITHKVVDQVNELAKNPVEAAFFHKLEDAKAWAALPAAQAVSGHSL